MGRPKLLVALLLVVLTVFACGIRYYIAMLDPFLHSWDEHFHALVARNMMDSPFVPRLRKGQLPPFDYKAWCCNDIWLHKQPLFLWQMALSMKLFGVSLLGMRLPSILMGAVMVPVLYHIGRMVSLSRSACFIAAALFSCCYYHLELVSGYYGMDHNDIAFSFYVLMSIWAYLHYEHKRTWKWALLTGAFAGCAILCKWLPGLLVYSGWSLVLLVPGQQRDIKRAVLHLAGSLTVAVCIALPWQLYILRYFPVEAKYEYAFSSRHIREAIEGHSGSWSYYFETFPQYFGPVVCWLVPFGLALFLLQKHPDRRPRAALAGMFVTSTFFYSFIAQTKVHAYLIPIVPIGYIAIAYGTEFCLQFLRQRRFRLLAAMLVLVVFSVLTLQPGAIRSNHSPDSPQRNAIIARTKVYRDLKNYVRPGTSVIMIVPAWEEIDVMFFNPGITAHSWAPDSAYFEKYIKRGDTVGFFPAHNGYAAPAYVRSYRNAYELPVRIQ